MSQEGWNDVDRYIADLFGLSDPALDEALAASDAAGLPPIQVPPNQGMLLNLLARSIGARRILEIGTLGGYSTIWLGRALPPDGKVITLEIDAGYAEVARGSIARAGLERIVEVRVGPALQALPGLVSEGPFDLVFIDADKSGYPDYLEWSLKLTRPGSLIIADNVVRDGEVIDPSSDDPNVRGVRRFNEMLAAEARLDATIVQTVGIKGYDGFAVALVTA
jgi:predicted O-methyltransferase YrrM